MEPKSFNEYWSEGIKEADGEWTCKYIESHFQWKYDPTKIKIWGNCTLDHFGRKCMGICSKYKENKSWFKKIFSR